MYVDVVVAADVVHGGGDAVPAIEMAVASMTLILANMMMSNLLLLIEEGGLLVCVTCSWVRSLPHLIDTRTPAGIDVVLGVH